MDENAVMDLLRPILDNLGLYSEDPAALQAALGGDDALAEVPRETYVAALDQVMEEKGVPADVRGTVADQLDAHGDYSSQGLLDHLNLVVNDQDVNNWVDQSLNNEGEVHGDLYQENDSNVANATGEGSLAGDEVYGNQVQTGDGQQVGGDSGVQNQGNNSGQQAGYDADADNITTGDHNTVGSDWASRVGAGQVSQDGAYINDSAQAYGEGSANNEANDSYTEESTFTTTETANDSFNSDYSDDDTQTQTTTVHGYGEPEYEEPVYEHEDEHHPEYEEHRPEYEDDSPDIHQHAEIIEHG
jgi:hypothetical protein